eukprot:TRINITY_DN110897_c0_g1_i1.p1 TRINITY_DN110897_c0_g1~~TRINITY_DN110897_c0_g1_i1.p1  ORF type:complete len:557 (-),score=133.11 TRINITY_DN110897_c0_g1_i1:184-1653(-)
MGENNWERFQVWVDEDPDKVLHPLHEDSNRECKVAGPEGRVDKALSWRISGKCEQVRLINEEQAARLEETTTQEELFSYAVAFGGNYVPAGVEKGAGIEAMPLVDTNAGMEGKPGDMYRIRLHVHGEYKRLEWSKARGVDAVAPLGKRRFVHRYHIIGDHSYWDFQEMQELAKEKGVYTAEVRLLKETSSFQIFRDGDFSQGFYPKEVLEHGDSSEVLGPDEFGHGKNWKITGKVGDVFRVTFKRRVRKGEDQRSIGWEHLRFEAVDFEELAKSHVYHMVGSWNSFEGCKEMRRDKDTGHWHQEVIIGKNGSETFQILLHANWLAAVHPNRNDATLRDDHELEGPDDGGSGKYWCIGTDPADGIGPGDHVMVYLDISAGQPCRVHWEKYDSPDAHQEYLAAGAQRVFERHVRLLGLVPWESNEKPARLVNPPEWYNAGRTKQAMLYSEAIVITPEMLGAGQAKEDDKLPHELDAELPTKRLEALEREPG